MVCSACFNGGKTSVHTEDLLEKQRRGKIPAD